MLKKLVASVAVALALCCTPAFAALTQHWKLDAPQVLRSATITAKQLTANVVTITTAAPHNFQIGEQVFVSTDGSPVTDNIAPKFTPFSITAVPSATTFSYARTAGNIPLTATSGTATVNWLNTAFDNRGMAYNEATGHVLVARGSGAINAGIHILNFDGSDLGEMKMGPDITNKARATNVVTLTTAQPHMLAVNQSVFVMCNPPDPTIDGVVVVTGVPTATDFTFTKAGADIASTPTGGTTNIACLGTVALIKLRAVKGGIYACSLSINTWSLTDPFTVYYWPSETAVPYVIQRNVSSDFTGSLSVTNKALTSNVATLTLPSTTGLLVNMPVAVALSPADPVFDGNYTITAVTATTITYAKTNANVASTPTGGTATQATPPFSVGPRLPLAGANNMRIGDTFDVVADGTLPNANVEIYTVRGVQASAGPVSRVYKLSFVANAAAVSAATETLLAGGSTANGGASAGTLWVDGFGGNLFMSSSLESGLWTNAGTGRMPTLQSTSAGDFNCGVLTSNSNGRGVTIGANKYFAYIERGTSGHPDVLNGYGRAALADVTAGFPSAAYIGNTGARTNWLRANTNGTGDVAWDDQTARTGRFFAMPTNQYVGSFSVPAVVAPSTKTWDGGASTNKWIDAANWNPDGVPTTDNDVVLDHSSVAAAYTVQVTGLHTVMCRTLTIDAANAATIKLRISGEGEPCGTPYQINGAGLSDISVAGTYAPPVTKDENTAPRFRVEILKGISAVTTKALASNVATLTTLASNGTDSQLVVGDTITVALNPADPIFDGTHTVTAKTATAVSYAVTNANVAATPTYGTVAPAIETIRWNNIGSATVTHFANGGVGSFGRAGASGVAIAAATPIALSNGYSIQFAAATGHTTGDAWVFNPLSVGNAMVIKGDGTAANDVVVQNGGVIENYATARFAYVPQTLNVWGGGNTCFFGPNGTYVHGIGNIAVSTQWPSDWTGAPFNYPVFDGATTWDAASNNVTDLYPIDALIVPANYPTLFRAMQYGNLSVLNSYTGLGLAANYSNVANTTGLRVKGNLVVGSGSSLTMQTSANVLLEGNVTNNGNATGLSLQTGTNPAVQFNGNTTYSGTSTGNTLATGYTVNPGSTLTLQGVDLLVPATMTATVRGTMSTDSAMTVNGTLAVSTGTLNCSANPVGGTGIVAVNEDATLGVKADGGINAQVTATGPNTYSTAANYVFNGAAAQVTGSALPATVRGLKVDNAAGVTLSGPVSVTGVLDLAAGELATGANALLAADGAPAVVRTAGFVNGTLQRTVDATVTGARAFPVGTAGAYAPVSINITSAGTGSGPVSVASVATDAPGLSQPTLAIDRHWNLSALSLSGYTATLGFQYLPGDVTGGVEANFVALRDDGLWSAPGASVVDTVNKTLTVSGIVGMSTWTVGEINAISASVNDWTLY